MDRTDLEMQEDKEYPLQPTGLVTETETDIEVGDGDLRLFQLLLDKIEDKIVNTPTSKFGFDDAQRAASAIQTMTVRKRVHLLGSDQVHKTEISGDEDKPIALLSVNNADYLRAILGQDEEGNTVDFSEQNEFSEAEGVAEVETDEDLEDE